MQRPLYLLARASVRLANWQSYQKMRLKKVAKIQGISASGLSAMVADAKSKVVAKRAPPIKYLLDDNNPFRKIYGSEKDECMEKAWAEAIQGEPTFTGAVCIKYLVCTSPSRRETSLNQS